VKTPPSSVMKSRRLLIRSARLRGRTAAANWIDQGRDALGLWQQLMQQHPSATVAIVRPFSSRLGG
jgi:hypothetical protein